MFNIISSRFKICDRNDPWYQVKVLPNDVQCLNTVKRLKAQCELFWNIVWVFFTGQKCLDPGSPLRGKLAADSFDDQSIVTFSCNDVGYELNGDSAIRCQGTTWNGTVPQCVGKKNIIFHEMFLQVERSVDLPDTDSIITNFPYLVGYKCWLKL